VPEEALPLPPLGRAPPRLACVDALRGLAALAVMIHHANSSFWRYSARPQMGLAAWSNAILRHGEFGVLLFFVISGLCIHLPHAGERAIEFKAFFQRRFWRLYPPYLVTCLIVFALAGVQKHPGVNPRNFMGHLVFVQFWRDFSDARGITPVLWSLAAEVQFYFFYALLLPMLRKIGFGRAAVLGILIGAIYRASFPHFAASVPVAMTPKLFAPIRFGEWLLGAWIAEAYARGMLRAMTARAAIILLSMGAALVVVGGRISTSRGFGERQEDWIASIGFALIMASLIRHESNRPIVSRSVVLDWLADRSYSLYLIHFAVISGAGIAWARLAHIPDRDAAAGTLRWLPGILIGLACSFVAGDLMFRLIERPSHRLARKLART
jgi:peptidoglycan/LPS O-acetylase OafA/YrhL